MILVALILLTALAFWLGNIRGYQTGINVGWESGQRAGYLQRKSLEFARIYGVPPERVHHPCTRKPNHDGPCNGTPCPPWLKLSETATACVRLCEAAECLESGQCGIHGGRWR